MGTIHLNDIYHTAPKVCQICRKIPIVWETDKSDPKQWAVSCDHVDEQKQGIYVEACGLTREKAVEIWNGFQRALGAGE